MQRSVIANKMCRQVLQYQKTIMVADKPERCDVFINHRRIDTNKNVAGLLYDHLARLNLRSFLDSKTMKPGDKIFEKIDTGLHTCKVHKLP